MVSRAGGLAGAAERSVGTVAVVRLDVDPKDLLQVPAPATPGAGGPTAWVMTFLWLMVVPTSLGQGCWTAHTKLRDQRW
jgi:hypothetical protein